MTGRPDVLRGTPELMRGFVLAIRPGSQGGGATRRSARLLRRPSDAFRQFSDPIEY
jgi:hypothetical protein